MATTVAGRDLVAERYNVAAGTACGVFLVIRPDGVVYRVDAAAQTCNCMAGQNKRMCCHRTQLQTLLRAETRRMLAQSEAVQATNPAQAGALLDEVEALVAQWQAARAAKEQPTLSAAAQTRWQGLGVAA